MVTDHPENGPYGPYGPYRSSPVETQETQEHVSDSDVIYLYKKLPTPPPDLSSSESKGPLSQTDFFDRVTHIKAQIDFLAAQISTIAQTHQRILFTTIPDYSSKAALAALTTNTQILITTIYDQIRFLEEDGIKTSKFYGDVRDGQIRKLKGLLHMNLEDYKDEEVLYIRSFREQIGRDYRIVNPDASDEEVREAIDADWGDEGVFQTALMTSRTAAASSVLNAVRQRHEDIKYIERSLIEINQLFMLLAPEVAIQEKPVHVMERQVDETYENTEGTNANLDTAIKSANRARRLKWICFWVALITILITVGVIVGVLKVNGKIK